MKTYVYVALVFFALVAACQSSTVQSNQSNKGVELYLVTTPVNLGVDAQALDKTPVTLADEPLLRYDQIEGYTADTYTFQVNESAMNQLAKVSSDVPLAGKPFALVVDGSVVYYGLFWSPISSFSAAYPFITLDKTNLSRVVPVEFRQPAPGGLARPDYRNDSRLLNRLRQDNKLN